MRYYILLFFLINLFGYSFAQTAVSGYYVTNANDTIHAQIRIPKSIFGSVDLSKFIFRVEVVDSISGSKKFKPEDIAKFGFLYNEEHYRFISKPTITENNLRFLQPAILGQKSSLYLFQTADSNGVPLGTFYTFEKADGTYTFLSTGIRNLDNFRDTLKEFYKDNVEVQQVIDKKFQSRSAINKDIIEIVRAANKSQSAIDNFN